MDVERVRGMKGMYRREGKGNERRRKNL